MGIEPTCSAWKADILPLNYTRLSFQQIILYHGKTKMSSRFSKKVVMHKKISGSNIFVHHISQHINKMYDYKTETLLINC